MPTTGRCSPPPSAPTGRRVAIASFGGAMRLWDIGRPAGPITAVACALLAEEDVAPLAEFYGVVIREPICGAATPAPDPARLDRR